MRPEAIARATPVGRPGVVLGGKYRLERRIATGGMASIWAATHVTLNRPVAVKFVDARMDPDETRRVERFLREAKVAASVRHKNVVDILDFGIYAEDGVAEPYMVMELLEGEPLDLRAQRAPLDTAQSVDVLRQVLGGLEAVHAAGIVHRDLKPGNVFVSEDGDGLFARVLDFGISVCPAEEDARMVIGTPEYMSPEQALGIAVDARSDVYAVGVMLYELLGGFVPYEHPDPAQILQLVVEGKAPSLSFVRPDVPELCHVAEIAMALRPEDRYQSALAMKQALASALRRDPTPIVELVTPAPARAREHTSDTEVDADAKTLRLLTPVASRRGLRAAASIVLMALFVGIAWWAIPRPQRIVHQVPPLPTRTPAPHVTPLVVVPDVVPAEPIVEPPPTTIVEEVEAEEVEPAPSTTPAAPARRARRSRRPVTTPPTAPDRITRELDF